MHVNLEEIDVEEVDMGAVGVTTTKRAAAALLLKGNNVREEAGKLVGCADGDGSGGKVGDKKVVEVGGDSAEGKDVRKI